MEKLREFLKLADRVKSFASTAYDSPLVQARALPGRGEKAVDRFRLTHAYIGEPLGKDEIEAGQRALKIIAASNRLAGEIEKRRLLREYAAELESLRAAIVHAAAAASIEIGVLARNVAKEAEG